LYQAFPVLLAYPTNKMKIIPLIIAIVLVSNACTYVLHPTEAYIKNEVQEHPAGSYSQIKIFRLFTSKPGKFEKNHSFVEFSAFKYNNDKKLVIASQKLISDHGVVLPAFDLVVLDETQVAELEKGFETAYSGLRKENRKIDELSYYDFSSTNDLFISVVNTNTTSATVQIWINKNKHEILATQMKTIIGKFKRY